MTDNYTPSTEEVRLAYAQNYVKTVEYHENGFAEFDRWYTAESARLRAEGAAEALGPVDRKCNRCGRFVSWPPARMIPVRDSVHPYTADSKCCVTTAPQGRRSEDDRLHTGHRGSALRLWMDWQRFAYHRESRERRAEFDRWFAAESARLTAEGAAEALSKVSELAATGDDGEPAEKWGEWLGNYAEHYRQSVTPVPEETRTVLMTEPHNGHEPSALCPGCPHEAVPEEGATNNVFPNDCLY